VNLGNVTRAPHLALRLARLAVGLSTVLATPEALAYRGASLDLGGSGPVAWRQRPIALEVVGVPAVGRAKLLTALGDAATTWTAPSCTSLDAGEMQFWETSTQPASGDGINSVAWISDGWSDGWWSSTCGVDAVGCTVVAYAQSDDGQWAIEEADVLLNGPLLANDAGELLDTTVLHELGHVLGLMHPCLLPGDPATGAPICDGTTSPALMNPLYADKAPVLEADDVQGICSLYPSSNPTNVQPSLTPGVGKVGDPCSVDGDCEAMVCDVSTSSCSVSCVTSEDCVSEVCNTRDATTGACEPSSSVLGAPCSAPEGCLGGYCVDGVADTPICTRACQGHCPVGWKCSAASGSEVCLPDEPTQLGGGCSVSSSRYSIHWASLVMALLCVLVQRLRTVSGRVS